MHKMRKIEFETDTSLRGHPSVSDKAAGAAGGACTQLLHLHAGHAHQPKIFVVLFSLVHPFAKIVSRVKCTIINIMFSIKGRDSSE